MPGIWMSINTTSGRRRRTSSIAATPSAASPQTRDPGLSSRGSRGGRRGRAPGRRRSGPRSGSSSSGSCGAPSGMPVNVSPRVRPRIIPRWDAGSPRGAMTARAGGRSVCVVDRRRRDVAHRPRPVRRDRSPTGCRRCSTPSVNDPAATHDRAAAAAGPAPRRSRCGAGYPLGAAAMFAAGCVVSGIPTFAPVPSRRRRTRGGAGPLLAGDGAARGRAPLSVWPRCSPGCVRGRDRVGRPRRRRRRGHGGFRGSALPCGLGRGAGRGRAGAHGGAARRALRAAAPPARGDRSAGGRDRPRATRLGSRCSRSGRGCRR